MMNQTIDGGQGYGLIGKNPSPFAEGLIGGDCPSSKYLRQVAA